MVIKQLQRNGESNERACQDGSLGNFVKVWMNSQEDVCKNPENFNKRLHFKKVGAVNRTNSMNCPFFRENHLFSF